MARERYDDWLARGRTHLADARPIDAIVCLRHALRIAPRGAEARFHLGEAAWHLGRRDEAIAHWREAIATACFKRMRRSCGESFIGGSRCRPFQTIWARRRQHIAKNPISAHS